MAISQKIAKINWIRDILTPLSVILMETFWIYPWLAFIGKWTALAVQRPPLRLISLILLLGISYIVTKFFLSRKWSMPWIQLSIILCGLLTIFLTVRLEYSSGFLLFGSGWFASYSQIALDSFSHLHPIVFALPIGIYMWWRGISLGRAPLYFDKIYHSFLFGLIAMVLLIIAWGVSAGAYSILIMTSTIGVHIMGFFFFGLAAMALANLHAIQERMKAKDRSVQTFGRRWLLVIVGVIGGLVLIGSGIASIFSTQIISFLGRILNFTYELLTKIVYYILIPIGFLEEWLVYLVKLLISWLTGGKTPAPTETPEFLTPENIEKGTGNLSPQVILILKWTVFALILIAIIYFLYKAITRFRSSRAKDEVDEEQESLWSWGEFKSDIGLFLHMLRNRFKRQKKLLPENPAPDYQGSDDDTHVRLSIREIYRHLLRQTAKLGIPREDDETPYEYNRRLGRIVPDGKEPLTELTKLYVDVRYGDRQIEDKKIDDANSLWRRLYIILFK